MFVIRVGRRPRQEDSKLQVSLDDTVRLCFRTTAKKQFTAELIANDKIDIEEEKENDLLAVLVLKIFCAFSQKEANRIQLGSKLTLTGDIGK